MQQKRIPGVIFVGAFGDKHKNQLIGGVKYACETLLSSPLADLANWYLIDSTARKQHSKNLIDRTYHAIWRLIHFVWILAFKKPAAILIFSPFFSASLLEKGIMCLLGRAAGKRVVLSLRTEIKRPGSKRFFDFTRRVIQSCDVIICQSEMAAQAIADLYGPDLPDLLVQHNWIDAAAYSPPATRRANEIPAFVYVGWLVGTKGLKELFEACRLLVEQEISFHLTLCGDGPLREELEQELIDRQLEEQIAILGWVDKEALIEVLHRSDIFVLPTYSEGMPNALIEAMAAGLAVITTAVGGIPSLVDTEKNGLLVPPQDATALAAAMARLAADTGLVRQMGKINLSTIAQKHSLDRAWPRVATALGIESYPEN